jgi:tetratricopeptide (TPR) repeat protein
LSENAYNLDESYEWDEYDYAADGFVSAIALNDLGIFDESVELLKRVDTDKLGDYLVGLLITPEMYMDVYGVALSGAGQKDEALIAFEKSLEYNSDYEPAKEHLKNLNTN